MSVTVKHWQDPINLVLGIWLVASPWALAYDAEFVPMWNAVAVGILVAIFALFEFFNVEAWEEWANFALGIWLAASPWVLGFSAMMAAMGNAIIVGVVIAALALWALGTDKNIGGWWSPAT